MGHNSSYIKRKEDINFYRNYRKEGTDGRAAEIATRGRWKEPSPKGEVAVHVSRAFLTYRSHFCPQFWVPNFPILGISAPKYAAEIAGSNTTK